LPEFDDVAIPPQFIETPPPASTSERLTPPRAEREGLPPSYRMRAEIPGKFSALPTQASAMYAPELKGNSDELKLIIED